MSDRPILPRRESHPLEPFVSDVPRYVEVGQTITICLNFAQSEGHAWIWFPGRPKHYRAGDEMSGPFVIDWKVEVSPGWYAIIVAGEVYVEDEMKFAPYCISYLICVWDISDKIYVGDLRRADESTGNRIYTFSKDIEEVSYENMLVRQGILASLIADTIRADKQLAYAIVECFDPEDKNRGQFIRYEITHPICWSDTRANGVSRIGCIPETENAILQEKGLQIVCLLTREGLQLVPHDGKYWRADKVPDRHVDLDEQDDKELHRVLIKRFGEAEPLETFFFFVRQCFSPLYVPPSFTVLSQTIASLLTRGYHLTMLHSLSIAIVVVHQKTSKQPCVWLTVRPENDDSIADDDPRFYKDSAALVTAIESQGKNQIRIVSPLLTSAAIVEQGKSYNIYVDIPDSMLVDNADPAQLVAQNVVISRPPFSVLPFERVDFPYGARDQPLGSVIKMRSIKEQNDSYQFEFDRCFRGTRGQKRETNFVRSYKTVRNWGVPWRYRHLYEGDAASRSDPTSDQHEYAMRCYYRDYPSMIDECENLFRVTVQVDATVSPGIYLLRVVGSRDPRVHPLRVFEANKSEYKIAQITDLHCATRYDAFGSYLNKEERASYVNPNDSIRSYSHELNEYDFVVATGDVIEHANDGFPFAPDFFMDRNWIYFELLIRSQFSTPVLVCLGNHDYKHNPTAIKYYASDIGFGHYLDDSPVLFNDDILDIYSRKDIDDLVHYYPFDRVGENKAEAATWVTRKTLCDYMFADDNALQYYFYNFCPFYDYYFTLGSLSFIFLDTKQDLRGFLADYVTAPTEGLDYLGSVLSDRNPPPISRGYTEFQFDLLWEALGRVSPMDGPLYGILFQHSAVLNPTLSLPDPILYPDNIIDLPKWQRTDIPLNKREDDKSRLDKMKVYADSIDKVLAFPFTTLLPGIVLRIPVRGSVPVADAIYSDTCDTLLRRREFEEAGVAKRRDRLLCHIGNAPGLIRLVSCGHVHKNLEFEVINAPGNEPRAGVLPTVYCGNFTGHDGGHAKGLKDDKAYIVTTISSGYLGYYWWPRANKGRSGLEKLLLMGYKSNIDMNAYGRSNHATGYREIVLSRDGRIKSMKILEKPAPKV